ncbi:hypothetical protein PVAND_007702 [Polypedilum vanderplanki]|uniref:Uncharacterized protein n=1 Tax=Polypedilum vanderplanki TaxID=319348 RepID=A0A9J6C8L6_POLVA|nr:hypothetical protein PVAND_007702 [Polypedilum vanderplanki]
MGLLAHCIIRGRILLQHAWRKEIDWDQEVADEDAELWSEWLNDLRKASTIQIPRRRVTVVNSLTDADSLELHTFVDAGQEAFAAVIYIVAVHQGRRESSFVIAKARSLLLN